MTDVQMAPSAIAPASLTSWPDLGKLRTLIKALRNQDARPPLTQKRHQSASVVLWITAPAGLRVTLASS